MPLTSPETLAATRVASQLTLRNCGSAHLSRWTPSGSTDDDDKPGVHYADRSGHADFFWETEREFTNFLRRLNEYALEQGMREFG